MHVWRLSLSSLDTRKPEESARSTGVNRSQQGSAGVSRGQQGSAGHFRTRQRAGTLCQWQKGAMNRIPTVGRTEQKVLG